jgi:ABC-type transport system substrate-binding protein
MSNGSYWDGFAAGRIGRRRLLQSGAAFSLGAAALALVGCGGDDGSALSGSSTSTPSASSSASGTPKPGGTYASYFATIANYNVTAGFHDSYNNSGITAYDRPITARQDTKGYFLEAADSIEVAEPTRIVMKLKPGMVYQNKEPANGRKVLASDIVATQAYIQKSTTAYLSNFQRTFLDHCEAPDDTTVVWIMKKPYAYLFSSTGFAEPSSQPIIPKEMLDVLDTHPAVGSGPFELTDNTFGVKYVYKKFDNFREAKNGMPYFTGREVYGITDAVALEAAFRSGQLSEWTPAASAIDRLNSELDKSKFANSAYLSTGMVSMNAMMNFAQGGDRPWKDIRFREAIYRLTNKDQLLSLGYDNKGVTNKTPLNAILEAWLIDAKDAEPYYKEDVDKAKSLLQAMNYDTSKEWEFVISTSSAANATLAEVWGQQLARGGIKTRVTAMANAEILPKKMAVSQFDMWVGQQPGGDTPQRWARQMHSVVNDQFGNIGLYDKDVDALVEKSEAATDRNENVDLIKQLEKKVLDLYTLNYNALTQQLAIYYDARLQDFLIDPFTGQDYQYQAWFA